MTLREQIQEDIRSVFLNFDDWADYHDVNGARVLCVLEKSSMYTRSANGRRTEGVHEDSCFLYIAADDFKTIPQPHDPIVIDGRKRFVRSVAEQIGIVIVEYGGVSDGVRVPGRVGRPF